MLEKFSLLGRGEDRAARLRSFKSIHVYGNNICWLLAGKDFSAGKLALGIRKQEKDPLRGDGGAVARYH